MSECNEFNHFLLWYLQCTCCSRCTFGRSKWPLIFVQLREVLAYWHGGHTVPRAAGLRTGTIGANANYHKVTGPCTEVRSQIPAFILLAIQLKPSKKAQHIIKSHPPPRPLHWTCSPMHFPNLCIQKRLMFRTFTFSRDAFECMIWKHLLQTCSREGTAALNLAGRRVRHDTTKLNVHQSSPAMLHGKR